MKSWFLLATIAPLVTFAACGNRDRSTAQGDETQADCVQMVRENPETRRAVMRQIMEDSDMHQEMMQMMQDMPGMEDMQGMEGMKGAPAPPKDS